MKYIYDIEDIYYNTDDIRLNRDNLKTDNYNNISKSELALKALNESAVMYYPLNGDTKDYSGNGNDATNHGAIIADGLDDKQCYYFDGSNDYIDLGNISNSLSKWTVNAWIKTEVPGDMPLAIGFRQCQFYLTSNFKIAYEGNTYYPSTGNGNLFDNSFHMLTASYDGTTVKLYVDNILDNQADKSWSALTGNCMLGRGHWSGKYNYYYNGSIQNVRIYDRVLLEEEINMLYTKKL